MTQIAIFVVEQRIGDGSTAESIVRDHERDQYIDLADSKIIACRVFKVKEE